MSFDALPQELKLRILLESVQQPHQDLRHAATLTLVCKNFYHSVSPLLWRHVRLTTPSQLRRFRAAADANVVPAALGMQSIHIGPDSDLDFHGWPVEVCQYGEGVYTYLITTLKEDRLPRWVRPGWSLDPEFPEKDDCNHWAVSRAVEVACQTLDISLRNIGGSHGRDSHRRISNKAWALRLWQAQAAMDLYLAEMREREDAREHGSTTAGDSDAGSTRDFASDECRFGLCKHHPALKLNLGGATGDEAAAPAEHESSLVLTRRQLLQHIGRRGGPANHFDHLILFARSRQRELRLDKFGWAMLQEELAGPHSDFLSGGADVDDDLYRAESDAADWDEQDAAGIEKAEDLLWMAREVLASTQKVTNLSLTGFFHRAINGLVEIDSLRRLNLGPLGHRWYHVLYELSPGRARINADYGDESESDNGVDTMSKLVKLRVCGMMSSRDARKIATQLPSLRSFVWECTGASYVEKEAHGVVQALQGRRGQRKAAGPWPKRRTEVLLRPKAVADLLAQASSPETKSAWSESRRASGALHALKIRASHNVDEEEEESESEETDRDDEAVERAEQRERATVQAQYRESLRFWEEGRVGMGLHSAAGEAK